MNSLPMRAILGGCTAAVAAVAVAGSAPLSTALALASVVVVAAIAAVAIATQSERLRDERRLVYRPVYARRQVVQHRVRSDD